MFKRIAIILAFAVVAFSSTTSAFAPASSTKGLVSRSALSPSTSTTAVSERRWNFNVGRGPWGMKKNAEIWNGRVAQMAFTLTLLQELITGKGVIQGLQEGDPVNIAFLGVAVASTVGLTVFLAIKGKEKDIVY
mmetsp:Transcript_35259/g.64821  ORF Transcript_35259/g.64821 Transcript_35259/m.64821 type:complete len:134 (-) Transcript_35259:378-779(-)|eukprot:CAMPEP_0197443274 /NCGR_PEP_ID=MMETSP1175-20131217/9044_1 /TAXON_ID=1003142 /ORGANISM="Triceratium dubium, Strain CCMP147" /LENGTH=133 /DNA_ID=CAMNT_0042973879 /DNA_START=187 /DNA_END=588 /DNA_ORIENTATION=-